MVLIAHVQCAVALSGGLLLFSRDAYATPDPERIPTGTLNSSRASVPKMRALIATMPRANFGIWAMPEWTW